MLKNRFRSLLFSDDWGDRLQTWIAVFLQMAIAGVMAGGLLERQWLVAFTAALILSLTFLPALIERQLHVRLPVEFTLTTCVFLYAAFGLGEIRSFYAIFWWWDLVLHSFAALLMGMIGFLLVYVFHMTRRISIAPIYLALFSFGFALTLGTLWEIFEFLMDTLFGFGMQKSGIVDTMTDLIVDALGGLGAAWIGYHYVKGSDSLFADRLVRRFVEKNPRLFRKKAFGRGQHRDA